jgi:hypothetical protein
MTSKYRSCHLEPSALLRINSVRDLSPNEPLPGFLKPAIKAKLMDLEY